MTAIVSGTSLYIKQKFFIKSSKINTLFAIQFAIFIFCYNMLDTFNGIK